MTAEERSRFSSRPSREALPAQPVEKAARASQYFDPAVLSKLDNLFFRARTVVEGFMSGLHSSPYVGFSVEFYEHREYSPGDDIRHIDWKAYGKFDRYYIKEHEEETNLRCQILLDCSASMGYRSDGVSKFEYGCYLAASLAYLLLRQQDAVGLVVFADDVRLTYPARSHLGHIRELTEKLEGISPWGQTAIGNVLPKVLGAMKKRGVLVVISDFFDSPEAVMTALKQMRYKGNEVVAFHVLDPDELEFPFKGLTIFRDMEEDRRTLVDPFSLKDEYLREMHAFLRQMERTCRAHEIDYALFDTRTPLDRALVRFLARRKARTA